MLQWAAFIRSQETVTLYVYAFIRDGESPPRLLCIVAPVAAPSWVQHSWRCPDDLVAVTADIVALAVPCGAPITLLGQFRNQLTRICPLYRLIWVSYWLIPLVHEFRWTGVAALSQGRHVRFIRSQWLCLRQRGLNMIRLHEGVFAHRHRVLAPFDCRVIQAQMSD